MFTPPNENLVWTVHRFRTSFVDDLGNRRTGTGTGFWISDPKGVRHFVTNKHNVDPFMIFGAATSFKLHSAEIELRKFQAAQSALPETRFFAVLDLDSIFVANTADCAVLVSPSLEKHVSDYPIADITKFKDLATAEDFAGNVIKVMEPAVFIGYPGAKGMSWSEQTWGLPIARQCALASWPGIPFTHSHIPTEDTILVSGLSFSGSSGSPVFVHERGLRPGAIVDPNWRPAKLIGIMSGHFKEDTEEAPMFAHTGLSYLTRSTSLVEVLKQCGLL